MKIDQLNQLLKKLQHISKYSDITTILATHIQNLNLSSGEELPFHSLLFLAEFFITHHLKFDRELKREYFYIIKSELSYPIKVLEDKLTENNLSVLSVEKQQNLKCHLEYLKQEGSYSNNFYKVLSFILKTKIKLLTRNESADIEDHEAFWFDQSMLYLHHQGMQGGQGLVRPVANEQFKVTHALKEFIEFPYRFNVKSYQLLHRDYHIVMMPNGELNLLTSWQPGKSLNKISEVALLQETFLKRFTGIMPLLHQIKKLHHEKLIFADLKPGNVVMDQNRQLSLIDFDCIKKLYAHGDKTTITYDFKYAQTIQNYRRSRFDKIYNQAVVLGEADTTFAQDLYSLGVLISTVFPEVIADFPFLNATPQEAYLYRHIIKSLFKVLLDTKIIVQLQDNLKQSLINNIITYCETLIGLLQANLLQDIRHVEDIFKKTISAEVDFPASTFKQPRNFASPDTIDAFGPTFISTKMSLRKAVKSVKSYRFLGREAYLIFHKNEISTITKKIGKKLSDIDKKEIGQIALTSRLQALVPALKELNMIHEVAKLHGNIEFYFDTQTMRIYLDQFQCVHRIESMQVYDKEQGKIDYIPHPLQITNVLTYSDDLIKLPKILRNLFPEIASQESNLNSVLLQAINYIYITINDNKPDFAFFTTARLIAYFEAILQMGEGLTKDKLEEIKSKTLLNLDTNANDMMVARIPPLTHSYQLQTEIIASISQLNLTDIEIKKIRGLSANNCKRLKFIIRNLLKHSLLSLQSLNQAIDRITIKLNPVNVSGAEYDIDLDAKKQVLILSNGSEYHFGLFPVNHSKRTEVFPAYSNKNLEGKPIAAVKFALWKQSDKQKKREVAYNNLFTNQPTWYVKLSEKVLHSRKEFAILPWQDGHHFYLSGNDLQKLTIFILLLNQLAKLHRLYRVHGDVADDNILNSDTDVNIIDFDCAHKNFSSRFEVTKPNFLLHNNYSFQRDMFGITVLLGRLYDFIIMKDDQADFDASMAYTPKRSPFEDIDWDEFYDTVGKDEPNKEIHLTSVKNHSIFNKQNERSITQKKSIAMLAREMTNYDREIPCTADRAWKYCMELRQDYANLTEEKLNQIRQQTLDAPIEVEDVLQMGGFGPL